MKLRMKQLSTLAALVALSTACGSNEAKNNRTLGGTEDAIEARKVHAEDGSAPADDTKKDDQTNTDAGATDGDDPAKKPDDETKLPPVNSVVVKAGLRNYEQINATMSTLTGIPRTNATVRTEFVTNLSTSLPTDNDVRAFLGSQQVAVFKLAVEYCDALVKDTTRRTAVFGAFNFAATPAVAYSAAGKAALADALVSKFWGKDLASLPPHADSTDQVVAVIDSLLVGKNLNTVAVTPAVATAVCTATLASAPVTMF